MNLSDEQQRAISDWAASQPIVTAIYLFGSRARGEAKPTSDADLAVAIDPSLDPRSTYAEARRQYETTNYTWRQQLAAAIGLVVDLYLLDPVTAERVAAAVDKDGVLIWRRR